MGYCQTGVGVLVLTAVYMLFCPQAMEWKVALRW